MTAASCSSTRTPRPTSATRWQSRARRGPVRDRLPRGHGHRGRLIAPVAVLAGGLGTRLPAVTGETSRRPWFRSRPALHRPQALELRAPASEVLLLVGHGADEIRDHVGIGSALGLRVEYLEDGPALLGTGGAIARRSASATVLGDVRGHAARGRPRRRGSQPQDGGMPALMTVLHNRDRWEPSNVLVRDGRSSPTGRTPPRGAEHIDYGMLLFRADASEEWRPLRRSTWAPCSGDWVRTVDGRLRGRPALRRHRDPRCARRDRDVAARAEATATNQGDVRRAWR